MEASGSQLKPLHLPQEERGPRRLGGWPQATWRGLFWVPQVLS